MDADLARPWEVLGVLGNVSAHLQGVYTQITPRGCNNKPMYQKMGARLRNEAEQILFQPEGDTGWMIGPRDRMHDCLQTGWLDAPSDRGCENMPDEPSCVGRWKETSGNKDQADPWNTVTDLEITRWALAMKIGNMGLYEQFAGLFEMVNAMSGQRDGEGWCNGKPVWQNAKTQHVLFQPRDSSGWVIGMADRMLDCSHLGYIRTPDDNTCAESPLHPSCTGRWMFAEPRVPTRPRAGQRDTDDLIGNITWLSVPDLLVTPMPGDSPWPGAYTVMGGKLKQTSGRYLADPFVSCNGAPVYRKATIDGPFPLRQSATKATGSDHGFALFQPVGEEAWVVGPSSLLKVRNATFCDAIYIQNALFYQDRLGTNIGKLKKRWRFAQNCSVEKHLIATHEMVRKEHFLRYLILKRCTFAKTGSGQTSEMLRNMDAFSAGSELLACCGWRGPGAAISPGASGCVALHTDRSVRKRIFLRCHFIL
jgi:hypothetical protein